MTITPGLIENFAVSAGAYVAAVVAAEDERWLRQLVAPVRPQRAPEVEQQRAEDPETEVAQPGLAPGRLAQERELLLEHRVLQQLLKS